MVGMIPTSIVNDSTRTQDGPEQTLTMRAKLQAIQARTASQDARDARHTGPLAEIGCVGMLPVSRRAEQQRLSGRFSVPCAPTLASRPQAA